MQKWVRNSIVTFDYLNIKLLLTEDANQIFTKKPLRKLANIFHVEGRKILADPKLNLARLM